MLVMLERRPVLVICMPVSQYTSLPSACLAIAVLYAYCASTQASNNSYLTVGGVMVMDALGFPYTSTLESAEASEHLQIVCIA